MSHRNTIILLFISICLLFSSYAANTQKVNDSPAKPGEWGFHPADGSTIEVTPPGFTWRPQKPLVNYHVQCSRESNFSSPEYEAKNITYNVHTPPETFPSGKWYWRFRYTTDDGNLSEWSQTRVFSIAENPEELPLPSKENLLKRIPESHPRLFVRPEQIPNLKKRAQTDLKDIYDELVTRCESIMNNPPPTKEPPKYPEGTKRKSEEWRAIWWGNRTYTIHALNGAATLGFTRLLGGKEEYGQLAREILMDCAEWDPKGSTGYRYNDEAGMPYNYYFSRTYTFINDLLSEEEKEKCGKVMKIRGDEMYYHLYPRHLWRPYSSHSNRAWHFLGEIGIAFLNEVQSAEDWVWFAANVFTNVYPVWSDSDGGWHEGTAYWRSYIRRFAWWADVMREAMRINAFDKPYFSQVGYYPMYLQPPGTEGGGFGDLTARLDSKGNCGLMSIFAAQAQNPYWRWYVDVHNYKPDRDTYIDFVRGALSEVSSIPPTDLPSSRCFEGVGQAMLNTNLQDAHDNVEIIFKSSPFGTQSHGYEANNSFLLYAFGERLFIRTGRRDLYGSKHHTQWMWHTKSTNCITVNGETQGKRTAEAKGKILNFQTGSLFDYVSGEAGDAYEGKLNSFKRRILFIKPEAVVIFDTLEAPHPSSFEWWLHSPNEMEIHNQNDIRAVNHQAACKANFLWPANLEISQTNKFDPPPRPRIKLVEYHLKAQTRSRAKQKCFITVLRPHRSQQQISGDATLSLIDGGYAVQIPMKEGSATVLLQQEGGKEISGKGLKTDGEVGAAVFDSDGQMEDTFVVNGDSTHQDG